MADITAEIPTVEEVLTRAAAASDVSTIVSEALERRSSNSSVAAFSPFIVADVKEVNDIPEVSMTESVYNARRQQNVPAPVEEPPVIDTATTSLPDSTETSADESEPLIPISHRPLEIADTVTSIATDDVVEPDVVEATSEEAEAEASSDNEHVDELSDEESESEEEEDEENTVHSDEEAEKPQPNLAAHIPVEIMFLLFMVLILNFFNFLLTLTGARQCLRPY
jgi:hypothetical protein